VLVTHHVEEIPRTVTHALLLRAARVVASGPLEEALTAASLSETFTLDIRLSRADGRWSARSSTG
jgi:iron complex transport system ATP-binding protein